MANIKVGDVLRVQVEFVDYDPLAGTDEFLSPLSVTAALYKYIDNVFVLQGALTPIVQVNAYTFYYDWTTPEDGKFMLRFDANMGSAIHIIHDRVFYVGTAEPTIILDKDLEYCFITALDPLYLDPEEIFTYYNVPEDHCYPSEVTEIIHKLSLQLESWFGEDIDPVTTLMHDWLVAATMCELSKIYYFDGGMSGFSVGDSFMLGDLQVSKKSGNSSNGNNDVNRGNAANWCELAALYREELLYAIIGMKGVVRGGALPNPIPCRKLRSFERG